MAVLTLVLIVLAVFAAWNFLLPFLPDSWGPIYPTFVFGLAVGAAYVDHRILQAAAVAGAVGILYTLVSRLGASTPPITLPQIPRRRQTPEQPTLRGVGSRVPQVP